MGMVLAAKRARRITPPRLRLSTNSPRRTQNSAAQPIQKMPSHSPAERAAISSSDMGRDSCWSALGRAHTDVPCRRRGLFDAPAVMKRVGRHELSFRRSPRPPGGQDRIRAMNLGLSLSVRPSSQRAARPPHHSQTCAFALHRGFSGPRRPPCHSPAQRVARQGGQPGGWRSGHSSRPMRSRRWPVQPALYGSSPRPKSSAAAPSCSISRRIISAVSTVPGDSARAASSCASFSTVAVPPGQHPVLRRHRHAVAAQHAQPQRAGGGGLRSSAAVKRGNGSGCFQLRA